jgi:hypothetical protein
LVHAEKYKDAKEQEVQVINDQAHRRLRKPAGRRPERRRSSETEHGSNQPPNASHDQQQHHYEQEVGWLRGAKLRLL